MLVMRAPLTRRGFLLTTLPLAMGLLGCQAPGQVLNGTGPVAQIALPKQVAVVVPVPDQPSADRLAGRVRDFQNVNPNVTIDLRPITGMPRGPFDVDKWVDMLTALASSALLDAAIGWDVWAPDMIDRGLLRPLDPYLADVGRPIERFFMLSAVQAFRRFGRVWMMPWQAQPVMLFYNRQSFDQAGLPMPDRRWTWREIETYGAQLTKGTEKAKTWGFDLGSALDVLIYQNGGRLVDDPIEPTRPLLDDPVNIQALAWVDDLLKRLRIIPSPVDLRGPEQRMGAFAGGQIAMRLDRMGVRAGTFVGSPKPWGFPWSAAPPPGQVTRATSANFQSWGILAASTKVDESWTFIRHLCTRLPSEARIDGIPAFLALQDTPDLGRLLPEGTESYLRALADTVPTPAVPVANTIQTLLAIALGKVMGNAMTPGDALREAQAGALKAWTKQPKPTVVPASS